MWYFYTISSQGITHINRDILNEQDGNFFSQTEILQPGGYKQMFSPGKP